jgi:hypothetical protein
MQRMRFALKIPAIQGFARRSGWAAVAVAALTTVGCGHGETVVRPFVKRGGDGAAEKTPAEKTRAEKTPTEKTPASQKAGEKTNP